MILWRISNYATLEGNGGLKASGRWHTRGHRVVYLAATPSAALLEILVHLELTIDSLPRSYKLLEIQTPDDLVIETLAKTALPEGWKENQALTRQLGDAWLNRNASALLEVPSALVPFTSNFLFNPQHPNAAKITIASVSDHPLDERLLP